jgi:hypothetical protein
MSLFCRHIHPLDWIGWSITHYGETVDETRTGECAHQNQAIDELQRATRLFRLV